jgi:hypothetical protein
MVLHLENSSLLKVPKDVASMPKRYFAIMATKAMSNQVVSQVIQDLKNKQETEAKQSQAQAETVSNEPPQ